MQTLTATIVEVKPTDSTRYGLRAPKGGCTVAGKVYKGGQFCLPYDVANPHGVETVEIVETSAPEFTGRAVYAYARAHRMIPAFVAFGVANGLPRLMINWNADQATDAYLMVTAEVAEDRQFDRLANRSEAIDAVCSGSIS